ncbi:MAG: glycosyltransferase family 2 protein [Acidobacteria bacterium]|nr:MAG: glycosyltransferase family 2 protein [Acidobacteriota bacterium]
MQSISATIITRNEAAHIARAIRSLDCADEILVVDSGSTDDTVKIAAALGARTVTHSWEGFAAQKNFAVRKASHDWVLSLDADEELNDEARAAIREWKQLTPRVGAYCLARRARYLGRWILHSGWYPDRKIRLFHRGRARWAGDYVHESVVADGPVETLNGEILHYTCDSLADHRKRIDFYTGLAAQEMIDRGQHAGFAQRMLAPPWVFFHTYIFRLGVLDGAPGFLIAWMAARYVRRKYARLAELEKSAKGRH